MIPTKKLAERLGKYFEENPPNLGDAESILDALYWLCIENNVDTKAVKEQISRLREYLTLHGQEFDEVFYIVSALCLEQGKTAFRDGIYMGIKLMQEVEKE